jgi:hypothetical protein
VSEDVNTSKTSSNKETLDERDSIFVLGIRSVKNPLKSKFSVSSKKTDIPLQDKSGFLSKFKRLPRCSCNFSRTAPAGSKCFEE